MKIQSVTFTKILLVLACFALLPKVRAVVPAPDGGYPGQNTAEGDGALFNLTIGMYNTALGYQALHADTSGGGNTAVGARTLLSLTNGGANTAVGFNALELTNSGDGNTALGADALTDNTNGHDNTASGVESLRSNTTGDSNTATGSNALSSNASGSFNTATGVNALLSNTGNTNTAHGADALQDNTTGYQNVASGAVALFSNMSGHDNTANGFQALLNNTTGSNNIALGARAGSNLTTGSNNIDIGADGSGNEANTIRIGKTGTQQKTCIAGISGKIVANGVGVIINPSGQLGTIQSSARFKDEVKPMDKSSEALLKLKPVTFRYKEELDPDKIPQFGLIAEEVEKVNPDLVARDAKGEPYTVRYDAVNAMLLNEFLKEHRKNEEQEKTIAELKSGMTALAATVKDKAAQIQKVSAQLEASKPAPRTVVDNR